MATEQLTGLGPVEAFALVGVLGVGSQWLAWRLKLPAIVPMLATGILVGLLRHLLARCTILPSVNKRSPMDYLLRWLRFWHLYSS